MLYKTDDKQLSDKERYLAAYENPDIMALIKKLIYFDSYYWVKRFIEIIISNKL